MAESVTTLAVLRRRIASLEGAPAAKACARVATGHAPVDQALQGGFARGRLHELFGRVEDEGAAVGLGLILAHLAAGDAPLFWLRGGGKATAQAYGPGLVALGLDPTKLLIGMMASEALLLQAAADALRCPALGALVIELRGRAPLLDLTASRRLALAAEASGVTALLLRVAAEPAPSTAETRWIVRAAHSPPGNSSSAWGAPMFDAQLVRNRHGPVGRWIMEWKCDECLFVEPSAYPQPVAAAPAHRPHQAVHSVFKRSGYRFA